MPHVVIKCFPGRTEQQKKECANKISKVIANTLECKETSVSVAIKDVPESLWKEEVWEKEIIPQKDILFKEPGYNCN